MAGNGRGPGTNWLAPLMGGIALIFVGFVPVLAGSELGAFTLLLGLAGVAFVIYGLVKRDRSIRGD